MMIEADENHPSVRREGRRVGRKRVQRLMRIHWHHGLARDMPEAEHEQAASRA
jgi:hypothetical protein